MAPGAVSPRSVVVGVLGIECPDLDAAGLFLWGQRGRQDYHDLVVRRNLGLNAASAREHRHVILAQHPDDRTSGDPLEAELAALGVA